MVLHTEFRDGNVPAWYKDLRRLKEALGYVPGGVKAVRLRSDNAGYWHHLLKYCETGKSQRCGKSEKAHGIMKNDLAGGQLPSSSFGENPAWWLCKILAFNLNALMKNQVLEGQWKSKRMKAIRYRIIRVPAKIINHSRDLIIQLPRRNPSFWLLKAARRRII